MAIQGIVAVVSLVITVASTLYQIRQAKKQKDKARAAAEARKGYEIPVEAEAIHLPKVYGRAKIGGARVYHNTLSDFNYTTPNADKTFLTGLTAGDRTRTIDYTFAFRGIVVTPGYSATTLTYSMTGKKNAFLYFQQALCQGPINAAYDVILDQSRGLDDPSLGTDLYKKESNEIEAAMRIDVNYTGGEADSIFSINFADRSRAFFHDICYASVTTRLDRENPQFSGIPEVQVLIEGCTVKTVSAGILSGSRTYSNSPPLVLLDYLMDTITGKGLSETEIHLESFEAANTVSSTIVMNDVVVAGNIWRPIDGSRNVTTRNIPLYECNLIIDPKKTIRENIEAILATMGDARLIWSQGKYKLSMQYPTSNGAIVLSGPTITDDDLDLNQQVEIAWPTASDRLNFCTVRYNNESENFKEDSVSWPPKLNPSIAMTDTYYTGLSGYRYPLASSAKGWDDAKVGGRLLNNYGVWQGNNFNTTLDFYFIVEKERAGTCNLEYTADDSMSFTLYEITSLSPYTESVVTSGSASNWKTVNTITLTGFGSVSEDKIYRLHATATDTSDETDKDAGSKTKSRGVAARIVKGTTIIWSTREPTYQTFVERSVSNSVYRTYFAEDNYMELETEIFAEGITDYYHALAKAEELVRTSRGSFRMKLKYIVTNRLYEPGDFVKLNSDALKIGNSTDAYFRVESFKLNEDFTAELELSRFDYSFLAWNVADDQIIRPPNLYDVYVPAPSWLLYSQAQDDKINESSGTLTWPAVAYSEIDSYVLYVNTDPDVVGDNGHPLFTELGRTLDTKFVLPPMVAEEAIFGIKTLSKNGRLSVMTLANVTASSDTDITVTSVALLHAWRQGLVISDPEFSISSIKKTYWVWGDVAGYDDLITLSTTGGVSGGALTIEGDPTQSSLEVWDKRTPNYPAVTGEQFTLTVRYKVTSAVQSDAFFKFDAMMADADYPLGDFVFADAQIRVDDLSTKVLNQWYEETKVITMQNNAPGSTQLPFARFLLTTYLTQGAVVFDTLNASKIGGAINFNETFEGGVLGDDGNFIDLSSGMGLPRSYAYSVEHPDILENIPWGQSASAPGYDLPNSISNNAVEVQLEASGENIYDRANLHTHSIVGSVVSSSGQLRYLLKSMYFLGTNLETSYIAIDPVHNYPDGDTKDSIALSAPLTVDFSIYPTDLSVPRALLSTGLNPSSVLNNAFLLYIDTDGIVKLLLDSWWGEDSNEASTTIIGPVSEAVIANSWNTVSFEWNLDGTAKIYVNGVAGSTYSICRYSSSTTTLLPNTFGGTDQPLLIGGAIADTATLFIIPTLKDFAGYASQIRIGAVTRYSNGLELQDLNDRGEAYPNNRYISTVLTKDNILAEVFDQDDLHIKGQQIWDKEPQMLLFDDIVGQYLDNLASASELEIAFVDKMVFGGNVLANEPSLLPEYLYGSFRQRYNSMFSEGGNSGLRTPLAAFQGDAVSHVWGRTDATPSPNSIPGSTNEVISIADPYILSTVSTEFTIEFYLYINETYGSPAAQTCIMGTRTNSTTYRFSLTKASHVLTMTIRANSSTTRTSTFTLSSGHYQSWIHIAIVRNGSGNIILYVNGVPGTIAVSCANWKKDKRPLYFGGNTEGTSGLIGQIARIRFSSVNRYPSAFSSDVPVNITPSISKENTHTFLSTNNIRYTDIPNISARMSFDYNPTRDSYGGIDLRNFAKIRFYSSYELNDYGNEQILGELVTNASKNAEMIGWEDLTNNPDNIIWRFSFTDDSDVSRIPILDIRKDGLYFSNSGTTTPSWKSITENTSFVTTESGTTYTLLATDEYVRFTNANPVTITINSNAITPISIGKTIRLRQAGNGTLSLSPGGGVTVNGSGSSALHTTIYLTKIGVDEWDVNYVA